MSDRKKYLNGIHTVVIKLGTQLLSDASGRLDAPFVASIAGQVAELRKRNIFVTLVSSGAIGCGVKELGLKDAPTDLAKLQAVAAVGQPPADGRVGRFIRNTRNSRSAIAPDP